MKISFCTTVMNRLNHLKETLLTNLKDCREDDNIEFLILDYNSNDGLEKWMQENISNFDNKVTYYRTTEAQYYNRSHSRNIIFRLANGDILVNLDADNYVGSGFPQYIEQVFKNQNNCYLCPTPDSSSNTFGKIAFSKEDFFLVRGYDESLEGYGFEDFDIKSRIQNLGRTEINFTNEIFLKAISHSTEDRIKNERIYNQINKIYVNKINHQQTQVFMIMNNGWFESVTISDKYFEYIPQSSIATISLQGRYVIIPESIKSGKFAQSDFDEFQEIADRKTQIDLIHFYSQLKNKKVYFDNQSSTKQNLVNPTGYGMGVVYKNFDYQKPIILS